MNQNNIIKHPDLKNSLKPMLYIYKKELEWYERLAVDKESRQTESLGRAAKKYKKRL